MQVSRENLNKLFVAAGYQPTNWPNKRMTDKIKGMPDLLKDAEFAAKLQSDTASEDLADKIVRAVNDKTNIEITNADGNVAFTVTFEGVPAPAPVQTAPAASSGTAAPAGDGTKKQGPVKAAGPAGEGIIGTIQKILEAATEQSPVTKKDIVAQLAAKFTDRKAEAMEKTVQVQVPTRLKKDKKLDVRKNDKGYWIEKSAGSASPPAEPAPAAAPATAA